MPINKTRTPIEVVRAYTDEFWNKQNFEIANEIIAEAITRHTVGASPMTLTRAEAKQRGYDLAKKYPDWKFELVHAFAEGEMVCTVYSAIGTMVDGTASRLGSIEVFKVINGQIVAVWNNTKDRGIWDQL